MHPAHRPPTKETGFTLLETVFTVVVLAVLTKVALMKEVTPATMTLPTQAQSLADLIRRAQSLAMVRGQRMSVTTSDANGSVAIACASGSMPCNTDTSLTVSQGAVLASLDASTIYFNTLGQPLNNVGAALPSDARFTLSYQTATYTVTVAALTGRVSVSP